jgi:non-specific serine/threonine protein kinase
LGKPDGSQQRADGSGAAMTDSRNKAQNDVRSKSLGIAGLDQAEEIGRGGFGVVYRARQLALNRWVAAKVLLAEQLDERDRSRFLREMRLMGALSGHPGIVTIFEGGVSERGQPYILMEYLAGGSLEDFLEREGPLGWRSALGIASELGEALGVAHAAGILHRDVKPKNILISQHGRTKIGDFGIARLATADAASASVMHISIAHVPPEILRDERVTPASDVFSLASTVATMLLGRPPFVQQQDEPLAATFSHILTGSAPELWQLEMPPSLRSILRKSLDGEAQRRPQDGQAFADEIRQTARDAGVELELCREQARLRLLRRGPLKTDAAAVSPPTQMPDNGPTSDPEPTAQPEQRGRPTLQDSAPRPTWPPRGSVSGSEASSSFPSPSDEPEKTRPWPPPPFLPSQIPPRTTQRIWRPRGREMLVLAASLVVLFGGLTGLLIVLHSRPAPSSQQSNLIPSLVARTSAGEWSQIAPLPAPRYDFAAVSANGNIYAIGGKDPAGQPQATVYSLTPTQNSWRQVAALPEPLYGLGAVAIGTQIYVIGGENSDGPLAIALSYDSRSNTWSPLPNMTTARLHPAVTAVAGNLYAIGGTDTHGAALSSVDVFDSRDRTWTSGPSLHIARSGAAAIGILGSIYVLGGDNSSGPLNSVESFDPGSASWSILPSMPTPREYLARGTDNLGWIYTFGGLANGPLATLELYSVTERKWFEAPNLPYAVYGAASVSVRGKLYVIGGFTSGGVVSTVEVLTAGPH